MFAIDTLKLFEFSIQTGKGFEVVPTIGWRAQSPKVRSRGHQSVIASGLMRKEAFEKTF
jgi:hypothetical protein